MPRPRNPDAAEALLEAARAEFARRGLDRARIEDITRRAGLSKGAFYLHFRSKEEVFRLLLERVLGALEEQACRREEEAAAGRRAAPAGAGEADHLAAALDAECAWDTAMLEVLWRNRHLLAAVDSAGSGPTARLLDGFRRRMSALVIENLAARKAAGQLRPELDPVAVADVIVGAYEAFSRRMARMPEKPDLAGWARTVLHVVYLGALEPVGPGRRPGRTG